MALPCRVAASDRRPSLCWTGPLRERIRWSEPSGHQRIADVPTATSTPLMRSCRPTSTKTLGPRRGLRVCGDHYWRVPPLRASRQAASDRCCCPRRRRPGRSPRSGATAHHHGPVPRRSVALLCLFGVHSGGEGWKRCSWENPLGAPTRRPLRQLGRPSTSVLAARTSSSRRRRSLHPQEMPGSGSFTATQMPLTRRGYSVLNSKNSHNLGAPLRNRTVDLLLTMYRC
jgi:hypothetical protein